MFHITKTNVFRKIFLPVFRIRLRVSRFDLYLIFILLTFQALMAGLSLYQGIYHFHAAFIKYNYIQILTLLATCVVIFYLSYRNNVRKYPSIGIFLIYLFLLTIYLLNILGVLFVIETLTNRSMFTSGTYVFTYSLLTIIGITVSKYDYPITGNFKEFYMNSMLHFKKNMGLYLSLTFIVASLGFLNVTFTYAIAFVFLINCIYLTKAVLANVRK